MFLCAFFGEGVAKAGAGALDRFINFFLKTPTKPHASLAVLTTSSGNLMQLFPFL